MERNVFCNRLPIVHKETFVANILGGKLDAVQGRITEGEIFFCEVSVHKEADSHAIHHA